VGMSMGEILDVALLDPPREVSQLAGEFVRLDGERVPVTISSSLMFDNDERVMGLVVIIRDQREMVSLRNQVITSDRLAAVGQLAAGIAHEINNPLAFVRSNLGLLHREWQEFSLDLAKLEVPDDALRATEEWDELLQESLEGVDRAVTIVRDVRDFSHAGSGEHELADLEQLLDQVLRMAGPQLNAGIEIEREYGEIDLVYCQPQRLKQLFLNLVVNAAHAIDGSGRIRVQTSCEDGRLIVIVEDDGCGIPEEVLEHVFDPFFTTKEVGVGTGLGLAISHEIARAHDGWIRVERGARGGSVFRVELPARGPGDSLPGITEPD
jgi:two-component system NtrC family sensor kinase